MITNYFKTIFIDRREGKIVLFGSLVYLLVWAVNKFLPTFFSIPPFYALMSPFVAFALSLTYVKMGGFKRTGFESGWFNTIILIAVLLMPFLVTAWSFIRR
jgi:hypothetical protein